MPSVCIRFVRGTAWDSRIIEYQTRAWVSHVEFIEKTETFGAMLDGGVMWRYCHAKCYRNLERWEVWEIPVVHYQYQVFLNFIQETWGRPYDWRAILSFGLGERDWRSPGSWFCSELVMMALEQMKVVLPPDKLPVCRLTPRDAYMVVSMLSYARMVESVER